MVFSSNFSLQVGCRNAGSLGTLDVIGFFGAITLGDRFVLDGQIVVRQGIEDKNYFLDNTTI